MIRDPFGARDTQTPAYAAIIAATITNDKTTITPGQLTGNLTLNLTLSSELTAGDEVVCIFTADGTARTVDFGTGFLAATSDLVVAISALQVATFIFNGTAFVEKAEPTGIDAVAVGTSATHTAGDGSDHADVATNTSGVSGNVTDIANALDGTTARTGQIKNTALVGAVAGTGNTVVEYGDGSIHQSKITLTNHTVALTDEAGVIAFLGSKVYDMPEGAILMLGAVSDLDITKNATGVNADWDGDMSMGTVTAGNDADLTSTEANIIPKTATPQASAAATTGNAQSTATENAVIDGTTTAVDAYLNVLVDDADHDVTSTPTSLIFNGTITLTWINLGDY